MYISVILYYCLWQVRLNKTKVDDENGDVVVAIDDDGNVGDDVVTDDNDVSLSLNSIKASKGEEELSLDLTLG